MDKTKKFDVIIIGGSYAGLAAAMSLGRSLRSVLIIDSGLPCNRQTPYSHNFLTQDGARPSEVSSQAKAQVSNYDSVVFQSGLAVQGERSKDGFIITTETGIKFEGKKLVFATGIKDIMPSIEGFDACWGNTIVHCPYCHGYEFRDKQTGVFINGEKTMHLVSLINNLTDKLTVLTNGPADLNQEARAKLQKRNIQVIESKIKEFTHKNGELDEVHFSDGTKLNFDVLYASIPFQQHSDIPENLGCMLNEHGYIQVNNLQQTTIPGVYACGDNAGMMRSLANAVAQGSLAGAILNKELVDEQF